MTLSWLGCKQSKIVPPHDPQSSPLDLADKFHNRDGALIMKNQPAEVEYFVDGGVGANCPISQALKQNPAYGTIISIAPPKKEDLEIKGRSALNWVQYLAREMTDGDEAY